MSYPLDSTVKTACLTWPTFRRPRWVGAIISTLRRSGSNGTAAEWLLSLMLIAMIVIYGMAWVHAMHGWTIAPIALGGLP